MARNVATALVGPPNTTVADLIGVFCSGIAGLWLGDAVSTMTELSPNPPMDTDGRREDSGGGVRELQARCSGLEFG